MAKTACGFCGGSGKITKEHIFAEWISSLLGAGRPDMTVRHSMARAGVPGKLWHANLISQTVRMPCHTCNSGWMSVLETHVAPFISPMMLDQGEVIVGLSAQVIIARWAVKIAMVHECIQPLRSRYFTQAERTDFMNGVMPVGATVWVGRYADHNRGVHCSSAGLFTKPDRVIDGHVLTFAVGQCMIQVFVKRAAPDHPVAVKPGPWRELLLEIWPPLLECSVTGAAVMWPPPLSARKLGIDTLLRRFADLGP
jgi:hypothetical protein